MPGLRIREKGCIGDQGEEMKKYEHGRFSGGGIIDLEDDHNKNGVVALTPKEWGRICDLIENEHGWTERELVENINDDNSSLWQK